MSPLSEVFLRHAPEEVRAAVANDAAFDGELGRFVERARGAWPGLALESTAFVRYVAERFAADQTLGGTHAEGLFLACACAGGDSRAVSGFRDSYGTVMEACYRRLGFHRQAEEITQRVLRIIFVNDGRGGPAILRYNGRGSLANWVRVLTVREAYRLTRSERRTAEREIGGIDERILEGAVSDEANPELLHLKQDYRAKFKTAFQQAFEHLDHRERNILRYQYLDGLNLEQIGAICDASRATVARWRAQARTRLLSETRRIMRDEFRIPLDEFSRAMRLIESHLDVSLSRLLRDVAGAEGPREPDA